MLGSGLRLSPRAVSPWGGPAARLRGLLMGVVPPAQFLRREYFGCARCQDNLQLGARLAVGRGLRLNFIPERHGRFSFQCVWVGALQEPGATRFLRCGYPPWHILGCGDHSPNTRTALRPAALA